MKRLQVMTLLFVPLFLMAQKQSLTVNFSNVLSNDGKLLVSIFKGKESYLQQKPFQSKSLDIENNAATWKLDSLPQGEYIIGAFHDENINGKMDFSETGMPQEGFAFSNNVQPKMGPPNADEMLFSVKGNENVFQNIKMINFGMKPKELKAVEVVGDRKQFVKTDADKTTYQVKENAALTTGSMRDAVRKLPGVMLSPSGDLSLNGKGVSVYIDGVPSRLSGTDLKSYMESLPANTIEKIELIENPGAAYEANNNGAIVNIITRGVAVSNFSGTLNLHYGYSKNHKLSPSLILNGQRNKVNWQLLTGYNWHQQNQWTDVEQTFTSFNPNVVFTHNSELKNLNRNIYFRPMLNYRLTQNSYVVINYNFNSFNNQHVTTSTNATQYLKPPINYTTRFNNPEVNKNNEFVVKYKTMLDSLGRSLQVTGYYSNYNKKSIGESTQKFQTSIYGLSNINLNLNNAYGKADLEIPFPKIRFTTGVKYNVTNAHNLGKYVNNSTSSGIFTQPNFTDEKDFTYNEQNIAAYLEARKTLGKLSATVGVRFEDLIYQSEVAGADSVIKGQVVKVFPTLNLLYRLAPNVNLTARYSKKIAMPAYDQLDPNSNGYFDSFSSSVGNQHLKPNFYDNYSLSVTAFNFASLGSYLSYSKNISLVSTTVKENSLVTTKTSNNFENIKMYGAYLSLPVPLGLITKGAEFFSQPMNMSNMSYFHFFVSCHFNDIKGYNYPNGVKPLWMFNINTHLALPLKLTLDGNWFHMFTGNYQIYTMKKPMNYWQVDLSRKFLKDKLEITAEATQLTAQSVLFNVPNATTSFSNTLDGVTYWLKLSYRFGSFKSKEETQIDVEKKELESGGINVRKQ